MSLGEREGEGRQVCSPGLLKPVFWTGSWTGEDDLLLTFKNGLSQVFLLDILRQLNPAAKATSEACNKNQSIYCSPSAGSAQGLLGPILC